MSPKLFSRIRLMLLWLMLASVALSAVLIGIWIIADNTFGERWLSTALTAAAFSFAAMLCVNVLCRQQRDVVMWVGVLVSLASFVIWQPVLWVDWWRVGMSDMPLTIAGTISTCVAAWCALAAVFKSQPAMNLATKIASRTTLALAAMVGGMVVMINVYQPWDDRVFAAFAIVSLLAGCGLLTSVSLSLMSRVRAVGRGETLGSSVVVELTCPRCATAQPMRAGLSRCMSCGLRFEIAVEEPICVCGYQLFQLTGVTCPECGREIPPEDRWAVHAAPPS